MTALQLAGVWVLSLVLATGLISRLHETPHEVIDRIPAARLAGVDTFIIGSSHSAAAFAPDFANDNMTALRLFRSSASGPEIIDLATATLPLKPRRIILEATPLIRQRLTAPRDPLSAWIVRANRNTRFSWRNPIHRKTQLLREYEHLDQIFDPLSVTAPQPPRMPRDWQDNAAFANLVTEARAAGTEILLIGYPQAASVTFSTDNAMSLTEQRAAMQALSETYDLPFFAPPITWPDALFADASHLNGAGRARYNNALAAWLATQ